MELVRVRTPSLPSLPVPLPSLPLPFPFFLSHIPPSQHTKQGRPAMTASLCEHASRLFVSHPSRRHPPTHLLHQTKLSFFFLFLFLFSVSTLTVAGQRHFPLMHAGHSAAPVPHASWYP